MTACLEFLLVHTWILPLFYFSVKVAVINLYKIVSNKGLYASIQELSSRIVVWVSPRTRAAVIFHVPFFSNIGKLDTSLMF